MPTSVWCCGFECGQLGAAGQHWSVSGSPTISTSTVRSGARSIRINPTAAFCAVSASGAGWATGNSRVHRGYIFFTTLPTAATPIEILGSNSGATSQGAFFNPADNKIYAGTRHNNLGASGVLVTTGRWIRIDVKINQTGNPWLIDVQVDGENCGQASEGLAAAGSGTCIIGSFITAFTADFFADDILISNTLADYPLGGGYVNHFVPTSDGTHTATTTTIVKGTIAVPVGGNVAGSTDVFNWVNAVPLLGGATDNTRLVNHQTNAATLYAEVVFGPAPGISLPATAPRGVEVITADRQAATATGDFITKLNDNGTENNIVARGVVAGVVTDRYARKHYTAGPAGAWKLTSGAGNFNNIRARFGYSSDATPDQYWRGIMIEAEFGYLPRPRTVNINQAVNRAATY